MGENDETAYALELRLTLGTSDEEEARRRAEKIEELLRLPENRKLFVEWAGFEVYAY